MSAVRKIGPASNARFLTNPPLASALSENAAMTALQLFRSGFDNVQIASRMDCTPGAAANALARARDEERRTVV